MTYILPEMIATVAVLSIPAVSKGIRQVIKIVDEQNFLKAKKTKTI